MFAPGLVGLLAVAAAGLPASAQAHGPVAPIALDYLARATRVPAGLKAKVVDGDQLMWLRVPAGETVVVLDYRGAPYLRFSSSGIEINHNSAMYYQNMTPFSQTPPANLGPRTPPKWEHVSGGQAYRWHDGRLHALASVALSPGVSLVGTWRVPILLDGRMTVISGGLWHADAPSIVWFWPIVVLLSCVLAAWWARRPALDRWTARVLALAAVAAVAAAALGQQLHGRPTVSVFQMIVLALIGAFVLWGVARVLFGRPRFFPYLVIAIVGLYQGLKLIPTLTDGFVLIALPAFIARAAAVIGIAAGAGLLLMIFRLPDSQAPRSGGGSGRTGAVEAGTPGSGLERAVG